MVSNDLPRAGRGRSKRREILWWGGLVAASAVLGLVIGVIGIALRSPPPKPAAVAPRAPVPATRSPGSAAPSKTEPPSVTVRSQPPGATLYKPDGTLLGKEPLTLPIDVGSTVVIQGRLDGYPPSTNFAENVQAGETITIQLFEGSDEPPPPKHRRERGSADDKSRRAGSSTSTDAGSDAGSGSGKKRGSGYDGNDIVD